MKRKVTLLALAIAITSLIALGSLAYFTAETRTANTITAGNVKIVLHEEDAAGQPFKDVDHVVPGDVIAKRVYVENTGSNPLYARIRVSQKFTGADGKVLDSKGIHFNINTDSWTEKDGWYYYNTALAPGAKTEKLFTTVTFDKALGNDYQNATAKIDVLAAAVQSANNGDKATDAAGWPTAP